MITMKKVLALAGFASIMYVSGASAMVTVTKHNFSAGSQAGGTLTRNVYLTTSGVGNEAKGEVCVFCHTPHGANASAPLWNRAMATAGAYSPYTSSTMDTQWADATTKQPRGISLACLSCHDGTIAIDALYNAPGPGNYQATPTSRNWTWTGLASDRTLPEDGRITNFTQDLRNQHPISIEYPRYGGTVNYDPMFYTPNATHTGTQARYFDEANLGKLDDNEVRLYVTNGDSRVFVECASCHNPHGTEAPTGQAGVDGINYNTFLRKTNNNSALCLTCHIK